MTYLARSLKKIFDTVCNNNNIRDLVKSKICFTRRNKLTFEGVVLKILHSFQDSVDFNLSTFFPQLKIPPVTAGAFSIARYKLKIDLFLDLNRQLNELIETFPAKLWMGYRLIAGDGTTVNIPVSKNTIEHFGLFRNSSKGGKTVMANACMLYDVLSNFVLTSSIAPFKDGEKTIMTQLIKETKLTDSIVILDRGFGYFSCLKILNNKNVNFCVRLKTSGLLFADKILNEASNDFILEWIPSEEERKTCRIKNLDTNPIKVRATKIKLPSGEIEILISSLWDIEKFSYENINELYQLRWNIEEGYKKLKPKMKLEQFGCKKQEGIYQEFYSHIFMMNLTTLIGNEAQKSIEIKTKNRKFKYKYNWINAYKFVDNSFIDLFKNNEIENIINKIISQIETSIIAIVPNRKFVRQTQSVNKHRYSPMYK